MKLFQIDKDDTGYCIWFWRKSFSGHTVHTKLISIHWNYKHLKGNDYFPRWDYHSNKGEKSNGDTCFDETLQLGYLFLGYTNWDLQNKKS